MAMDVALFLDTQRLSVVGRCMWAAVQDASPIQGPYSLESDSPPPPWPSMPNDRARYLSSSSSPWEFPPSHSPAGRGMQSWHPTCQGWESRCTT